MKIALLSDFTHVQVQRFLFPHVISEKLEIITVKH